MHLQSELHLKILPEKPLQPTRAMTFPSSSLFAAAEWGEKKVPEQFMWILQSQTSIHIRPPPPPPPPPPQSHLPCLTLPPEIPVRVLQKKVTLNRHYCSYIMWVVREPVTHISIYRPTLVVRSNLRTFTHELYLSEGLLLCFSRNFSILSHSRCPETLRLWTPKVYTVKSDKGTLL